MDTVTTRQRLSPERVRLFLTELERHGIAVEAARIASPGSRHPRGAVQSFRDLRRRSPEFAQAWDDAVEQANARLEMEIHRRAHGFEEEHRDGEGNITRVMRRYSDACLLAMARARLPGYAKSEVKVAAKVEHTSESDRELAEAVRKLADQMAPDLATEMIELGGTT